MMSGGTEVERGQSGRPHVCLEKIIEVRINVYLEHKRGSLFQDEIFVSDTLQLTPMPIRARQAM